MLRDGRDPECEQVAFRRAIEVGPLMDSSELYGRWFDWLYRHPLLGPLVALVLCSIPVFFLFLSTGTSPLICAVLAAVCCIVLPYPIALATNWRGVRQRAVVESFRRDESPPDPAEKDEPLS